MTGTAPAVTDVDTEGTVPALSIAGSCATASFDTAACAGSVTIRPPRRIAAARGLRSDRRASHPAQLVARRLLPRLDAWRRRLRDLPRRPRPPLVPRTARAGCPRLRLGRLCLLLDDEPLPPRPRGGRAVALGGDAAPQPRTRRRLQPALRTHGPPLRRPLHLERDRQRGVPRGRRRLRAREPRPRRPLRERRRVPLVSRRAAPRRSPERSLRGRRLPHSPRARRSA